MSDYILELISASGNESLVSRYANTVTTAESFRSESIKAAEVVVKKYKSNGILLFLENSFESLVMLESFLEAGAKFEVVALNCGRITSPVITKWKDRLEDLGIKLHEIRFDYENAKHISELESLQKEFEVAHMMSLFRMWTACRFDKCMVFSGELCIPQLDSLNKVSSWGLPDKRYMAIYNFSKSFYVEPFFVNSTHGLFKAQAESEFSAAIIALYREKEQALLAGDFAAKRIWFDQCGFRKLKDWPVTEDAESIWQSGLRYEDRNTHENFFRIVDSIRDIKHEDIKEVTEIDLSEPAYKSLNTLKYQELLARLQKHSSDFNTTGAAALCALQKGDEGDVAYAMFPYLMLHSQYKQSVDKIKEKVSQLDFYHNTSNFISSSDLHLREEFSDIVKFFEEKIRMYYEVQGKTVRDFELTHCWANLAKAGESHHLHRHPNSMLSGIFYLNDGGGGDTVFAKDSPENMVVFVTQKNLTPFNSLSVQVRPQTGKLVMFPSFLSHKTLPHADTQESRYTIAFNVFVRDSLGSFSAGSYLDLRKF